MQWPAATIESIRSNERYSLVGGPFGSNLTTRDYVDEGVPVIRGGNLPGDCKFLDDDFVFVSEEKADQLAANLAFSGDLVFTQRGTLGQVGLIPDGCAHQRYVLSQSQMKLKVDRSKADPIYVYYFFRQPETVQYIRNHDSSSGVPHINLAVLKAMRLPLPPLVGQQRIVETIGAYDDLIDNNRRRIKLLEDSVRLLFDEWFARLRFPGHELAASVENVPVGWTREPLGGSVVLRYGKALKAEDRSADGDVPVYGSSGMVGTHDKAMVTGPAIVVGRKGNVGSVFWSARDFWPIDTVYFVDAPTSDLYLYYALRNMHFISTDVAVPGLNRDLAYSRPLLTPPDELRVRFLEVAGPIHQQIDTLTAMNEKLRTARDLLLRRLMRGELTV